MKIEQKKIELIIPYDFNNRKHNEQQVERIAKSIKEFGFNQPLVLDEDNTILVGHGRLAAAKILNLKEIPCITIKGLSEENKKAYRILDNKLQNDSEWDFNNLELELGFLEDQNFDLEGWGLDDLKDLFPINEPEVIEDEGGGALPEETYIKKGDLIELGKHRVLCGDSTKAEDLEYLLGATLIDLVVTDPPYNVAQDTNLYAQDVSKSLSSLAKSEWDFDFKPKEFLNNIKEKLKKDSWIYVFTSHQLFGEIIEWMNQEREHSSFCVWCKPNPMPSLAKNTWTFAAELCCFSKQGKPVFNYPSGEHCLNWWDIPKKSDGSHPTQKALEVIARIIKHCSKKDSLVSDLFLGSGTTLIAADQLDRICYGMEIDPKYCQVILERYQKYCLERNKPFKCRINGVEFKGQNDQEERQAAA